MKQPMKKGSFVPKNVPGVGVGWVGHEGVGWVGWGGVGWVMKGWGGGGVGHVGVGWVKTQTQKIITCRVSIFTNGYKGMCMSRGKFLKPSQVTNKIIE